MTCATRERKARNARSHMRGLGAHLIPPHLEAAPWGRGRGRGELDPAPLGLGPGYCIVPVWARSGIFDIPPPPLPCAGVLTSPRLWGHAQGRTASLPSLQREPHRFREKRSALLDGVAGVLRWRQKWVPGPLSVCGPTQPVWGGERFLGSPRSWRQAASSAGGLRGPATSRFAAPFSGFNRISK